MSLNPTFQSFRGITRAAGLGQPPQAPTCERQGEEWLLPQSPGNSCSNHKLPLFLCCSCCAVLHLCRTYPSLATSLSKILSISHLLSLLPELPFYLGALCFCLSVFPNTHVALLRSTETTAKDLLSLTHSFGLAIPNHHFTSSTLPLPQHKLLALAFIALHSFASHF